MRKSGKKQMRKSGFEAYGYWWTLFRTGRGGMEGLLELFLLVPLVRCAPSFETSAPIGIDIIKWRRQCPLYQLLRAAFHAAPAKNAQHRLPGSRHGSAASQRRAAVKDNYQH